ncbi:MAG: RecX family transcriptional regulator [Bacillota bacterium]
MVLTHLDHRRGRSWYRAVADGGARSWVLDREAVKGLRFLAGPNLGLPRPLGEAEQRLLDEAERASARRRALHLLAHRGRSVAELRRLLGTWPFNASAVEDAVQWAGELGYLDDRALARDIVGVSLARGGAGRQELVARIESRGVDREVAVEAVEEGYPQEEEQRKATELARRHVRSLEPLPSEQKVARLYRYLARRGFEDEVVRHALCAVLGPEARRWLEAP